jgi:hypothetical protein
MNRFESECTEPTVKRVVMLDLSEKTHGNAIGIGLADYTTLGLVGKIDYRKTNLNCITGGRVELGKVPIALATEREAIETALNTLGLWTPDSLRALWVSDTKHLSILAASEALLRESAQRADLAVDDRPLFGLPFHADGALKRLKTFVSIH